METTVAAAAAESSWQLLFVQTHVAPYLFFMLGVVASDVLALHRLRRSQLYVTGAFACLFVVSFMLRSTHYADDVSAGYAFLLPAEDYVLFVSSLAFMGLSAPALFDEIRRRFATLPGGAPRDARPGE